MLRPSGQPSVSLSSALPSLRFSTFPEGLDSRACPGARLSFPWDMRYRAGVLRAVARLKTMLTENLQTLFIHRGPDLFSFLTGFAGFLGLTESRPLGKVEIDCRRQPAGRAERERTSQQCSPWWATEAKRSNEQAKVGPMGESRPSGKVENRKLGRAEDRLTEG